ncbi:hypothetical protein ROHU_005686 [Labeo rohita]|uniref:Uncharacterized protein n=1 Tax=Labeo rohita TaxID=84645 RepID=A0A498N488_LABRO|nr:hypothetical protein ROHU_005686 [Labeo rohita]
MFAGYEIWSSKLHQHNHFSCSSPQCLSTSTKMNLSELSLRKDKEERLGPKSDHYGPGDGSDNKESTTLGCSTPPLSSQSIHIT